MSEFPNSAILFPNDRKGNEKAPDLKGTGEVAGVEYNVAAWERTGKKGRFVTLKFEKKGDYAGKPDYSADEARKRAAAGDVGEGPF